MVAVDGSEAGVDDAPAVGVLGQAPGCSPSSRLARRCSAAASSSLRSRCSSASPTCMSAVPRSGPWVAARSSPAVRVRSAAPRRPWATCMSARPREQPRMSASTRRRSKLGDGGGVLARRRFEVAVGPVGEPDERGGRAAARGGRRRALRLAARSPWAIVPARSPRSSARPARYMAAWAGQAAELGLVVHDHARRRAVRRRASASMSSRSVVDALDVAGDHAGADQAEAEHGTVREHLASGRASSHGCWVASWRAWRRLGDGELDELGGPGVKSSAAMAWRIASARSPSASNQSLARRWRSATRSGCSSVEAGTEHVAEEVVVPVPPPAVVEGDEEEVRPLQRLEGRLGVAAAGDRGAQRSRQPAQDRGLEEEGPDVVGLAVQDLVDEVVDDEPVVTGEAGDERRTGRRGPGATARRAAARRSTPRSGLRGRRRPPR